MTTQTPTKVIDTGSLERANISGYWFSTQHTSSSSHKKRNCIRDDKDEKLTSVFTDVSCGNSCQPFCFICRL